MPGENLSRDEARELARAGFSVLALKCWCTQFMCTTATSPAFQS